MESVWLYTLSQWGHEQTEKYIDGLADAFGLLTTNPRLGKRCDNIRAGYSTWGSEAVQSLEIENYAVDFAFSGNSLETIPVETASTATQSAGWRISSH
jgi:plasmid stabilization system protein ParE